MLFELFENLAGGACNALTYRVWIVRVEALHGDATRRLFTSVVNCYAISDLHVSVPDVLCEHVP